MRLLHSEDLCASPGSIRQEGWWGAKTDRNQAKNKHIGRCGQTGKRGEAIARTPARKAADKDVIDVEYRHSAAWAQLHRHYGIAVMTHYRACCTADQTGEVAPVQSRRHRFQFLPPDNEQEERRRVGEIYYAEGWRADRDPAFKARRTRWCQRCSPVSPSQQDFFFNHLFWCLLLHLCWYFALFRTKTSLKCLLWIKSEFMLLSFIKEEYWLQHLFWF